MSASAKYAVKDGDGHQHALTPEQMMVLLNKISTYCTLVVARNYTSQQSRFTAQSVLDMIEDED